jgi:hypothetical protein
LNPAAGALSGAEIGSAFGPVGTAVGAVAGAIGGYFIAEKLNNLVFNNFPPGYWPGDKGAEEWGRRDGCGPKEGKRRFHKGVKQGDPMSGPRDKYGVDPSNGNVVDPEGEVIGNLND